jgi:hypothetical protein
LLLFLAFSDFDIHPVRRASEMRKRHFGEMNYSCNARRRENVLKLDVLGLLRLDLFLGLSQFLLQIETLAPELLDLVL